MFRPSAPRSLLALPLALALVACSSGDDGPTAAPVGDLLLTDATTDELLYLRAVAQGFQLEFEGGGFTDDLLAGAVPVDLLALDGPSLWLGRSALPEGNFVGARVTFDPAAFEAAALDGTAVVVTVGDHVLDATLAAPLTVAAGTYARIRADFDLQASLTGDAQNGVVIAATGTATADGSQTPIELAEFSGTVGPVDPVAGSFVLAAFADGDQTVPIGNVLVSVGPGALLIGAGGQVIGSPSAFLATLSPGETRVELDGTLGLGTVLAERIEVAGDLPQPGAQEVTLRGLVADLVPGQSFTLLWTEIELGAAAVTAALGADPSATVEVAVGPGTRFALEPTGELLDATALAIGQAVEVEFETFFAAPFPASEVEIESAAPQWLGTLTDATNLPADFELTLDAGQAAITSGLVETAATPVVVDLTAATVAFGAADGPTLAPGDLSDGLRLLVSGPVGGVPAAPAVAAVGVVARAGTLTGATVAALDEGAGTFETTGGTVGEPLGGGLVAGPLTIAVEPECLFEGAATTAAAFFALGVGATVDLEGIADTALPNRLRVWRVVSTAP